MAQSKPVLAESAAGIIGHDRLRIERSSKAIYFAALQLGELWPKVEEEIQHSAQQQLSNGWMRLPKFLQDQACQTYLQGNHAESTKVEGGAEVRRR